MLTLTLLIFKKNLIYFHLTCQHQTFRASIYCCTFVVSYSGSLKNSLGGTLSLYDSIKIWLN